MLKPACHLLSRPHQWVLMMVMVVSLLGNVLAFAGHHHDGHYNDSHCELCLAAAHLAGAPTVVAPALNLHPAALLIVATLDAWHDWQPRHFTKSRAPPLA